MARELTFKIKRNEYKVIPVKIDRKKLYGCIEILAMDDKGDPCSLVSTDESGRFIIPKGGTGLGILSQNGEWVERSELKTVNEDGKPAALLPSSFHTEIVLKDKVSVETFIDYSITDNKR